MKIKHLIKKSFETTYPYAGIESIEKSLKDNSFLVVLASGSFLGILTPLDIIESPHHLVIDCLHDKPRVDLEQDIESVLILMKESGNPALPVFDGVKFVGVITQTVITDYLSEYRKELERKISEHTVELAKANEKLKREREELKASGARFRNLVETTSDWIWEVDPNGIYTYGSPKVKDLLGYEADEIIGKTPFDFMPPDKAKRIMRIFQAIVKEKKSFSGLENTNLKKEGQLVVLETSGVPIFSSVGNFIGYRGINRDITERKMMEEELRKYREHLERQVEERTRELKKSQALLLQTEKMAGLGTLASGIAHEVNNPLASILTYVQLMQSKINDGTLTMDKVMEYAGRMEKVTEHCMNTIQGLLDFSRETKDTKQPLSLTEVIDASISLLFHQLELQNIKVSKELEGSTILANKNQLMQVFVNMLTNAKDAMPEGGKITIAAQKADGYVKIVISDTGTGIPEEYLNRIFDPFFTTKKVGKGTGVGLYLCYRIVENLGGTLEVGSEVGKGTTFTVKLPV